MLHAVLPEAVQQVGEVAGGAAVTGAGGAAAVFEYNRTNFLNDRKMRQETEYNIMEFRLTQADLWRDDIKEICALTTGKMRTYLIVNAVELSLIIMTVCEGRLSQRAPTWLTGAHTLAIAAAFTFLLMSVWFAMHATVAAKSYEVKLLTQFVRLPVPSWSQLEGARTYGSSFEEVDARQMFRVPFVMGSQESQLRNPPIGHSTESGSADVSTPAHFSTSPDSAEQAGANSTGLSQSTDPWGLEQTGDQIYELDGRLRHEPHNLRHIQLVQEALKYWQSYDAFARVAMSIGINQMLYILCYYVCGYVIVTNRAPAAGCFVSLLFLAAVITIIKLDMSLTAWEFRLACLLCIAGPLCIVVSSCCWVRFAPWAGVRFLVPIAFLSQGCWMFFLMYASRVVKNFGKTTFGVVLPMGFRSVLYSDVFAWLRRNKTLSSGSPYLTVDTPQQPPEKMEGHGPAAAAVRYEHGQPVPVRVDDLDGAAQRPECRSMRQEFDPLSFACDPESHEQTSMDETRLVGNGEIPGKVFIAALFMFGCLWLFCGIFETAASFNMTTFAIPPLLVGWRLPEHIVQPGWGTELRHLEGGREVLTHWPHAHIRAHGLACDSANQRILAATHFGLYTADMGDHSVIHFHASLLSSDLRGKYLQDAALACAAGKCEALVLNQGNLISRFGVLAGRVDPNAPAQSLPAMSVSDDWLKNSMQAADAPLENLTAVASGMECLNGATACVLVGTSANRILEMQQSGDINSAGGPELFANKLVWSIASDEPELSSGSLHRINKRYLGVLLEHSQRLEILDLSKGGSSAGLWELPAIGQWRAMCAIGDDLYMLGGGASPQLWRFPVPEPFRAWPLLTTSLKTEARSASKRHLRTRAHVDVAADLESNFFDESMPGLSLLQRKASTGSSTKTHAHRDTGEVADENGVNVVAGDDDRDGVDQLHEL